MKYNYYFVQKAELISKKIVKPNYVEKLYLFNLLKQSNTKLIQVFKKIKKFLAAQCMLNVQIKNENIVPIIKKKIIVKKYFL